MRYSLPHDEIVVAIREYCEKHYNIKQSSTISVKAYKAHDRSTVRADIEV